MGGLVPLVRSAGEARFGALETCGSVWSCPTCSAKILARRSDELVTALELAVARGWRVAMVTLTMRHSQADELAEQWDALSDAWAAASGRYSRARAAKRAAGVRGWIRRTEATHGSNGWHLHVHALVFVTGDTNSVDRLGAAMFDAWAARLDRAPGDLRPVASSGGLDVKLLDLAGAVAEVGHYVAKGVYESATTSAAAQELAGTGKKGRTGNRTPWGILDDAIAGDRHAQALWAEWERCSFGRRAITWSRGLRDELGLDEELADDQLAVDGPSEIVAWWPAPEWPAVRDAPLPVRRAMLAAAVSSDELDAAHGQVRDVALAYGLPEPRPPT